MTFVGTTSSDIDGSLANLFIASSAPVPGWARKFSNVERGYLDGWPSRNSRLSIRCNSGWVSLMAEPQRMVSNTPWWFKLVIESDKTPPTLLKIIINETWVGRYVWYTPLGVDIYDSKVGKTEQSNDPSTNSQIPLTIFLCFLTCKTVQVYS